MHVKMATRLKAWVWMVTFCLGIGDICGDPGPDASWWNRHVDSISCNKPGYFVNQADCRSFFRCVDRSTWNKPALQRYDFTCPSGMVFSQAASVCTKPGANGCADEWWPGSGEKNKGNDGPGGNSLERLPSLFGNRGSDSGKDPLDASFGSPSLDDSSTPGSDDASLDLFNGGSSSTTPGTDAGFDLFNKGDLSSFGGDPLDADFGSSPGDSKSPPLISGPGSRGPFGGNSEGVDPLDSDFGSSPPSGPGGSRPSPGSRGPFGGGNGLGSDPLDADFGSSPGSSSGSGEDSGSIERPNISKPGSSSPGNGRGGSFWASNPSKDSGSANSIEFDNWNPNENPGSASWGGASKPSSPSNPPPAMDNNPWRPSGPPWGSGSSNELGIEGSPLFPESPQQSSSTTHRPPPQTPNRPPPSSQISPPFNPNSPQNNHQNNRPSWWDPPFAAPYRPVTPAPAYSPLSPEPPYRPITAGPPHPPPLPPRGPPIHLSSPPDPWLQSFRPRYPTYQIVAYPTWPPPRPYGGREPPIIIVYSNSRK